MGKTNAECRQFRSQRARGLSACVWLAAAILALAVLPAASLAGEPSPAKAPAPPAPALAVAPDPFAGLEAVGVDELAGARGGERMVLNLEEMFGQVSGNSIEGTVNTGSATVSGESFQGLNGVSSVIINSGNNVSIQSSTTVNIVIDSGPATP